MANGQDPILDEIDRATGRSGSSATAVAEDPVLAEIDRVTKPKPPAPLPPYRFGTPRSFEESVAQKEVGPAQRGVSADQALQSQVEADRAITEAEDEGERATHGGSTIEESEAAKKRVKKPFALPEEPGFVERAQAQPQLTLPRAESQGAAPSMVRGEFGQPVLPTPLEPKPQPLPPSTIRAQKGAADYLDDLYGRIRDKIAPNRFDAKGNPLPSPGTYLGGPILGPLNMAAGMAKAGGSLLPEEANIAAPPEETPEQKKEREHQSEIALMGFNQATEGLFQTLAPLTVLDPAAIGAMPLYSHAAGLGQQVLEKSGMKPQTAQAVVDLALMFGPGMLHASRIEVPQDPARDFAVGLAHEAAKQATAEYPNFHNMTEKAQAGILEDLENRIMANFSNMNRAAKVRFAQTMGMDPTDLFRFAEDYKPEPPTETQALPSAPPREEAATPAREPAPTEPPTPETPAPPPEEEPTEEPSEQPAIERRSAQNAGLRRRISEMTPEEMRQELLTSPVTGMPNRRAFDEAEESPVVAMSDADGLKALNDKFGYEAGNALLKAKAEALEEAGLDAYHEKGDEFLYRGQNAEDLNASLENARNILRNRTIEVTMKDGTVRRFKGADFSYGTGETLADAEGALKGHKSEREARGERARGELRGITEIGPEEGQEHESPTQESQALALPEEPESLPESRAALLRTPNIVKGEMQDAVHRSMTSMAGFTDRIQALKENGATDEKIKQVAAESFGSHGGGTSEHGMFEYRGGNEPSVTITGHRGKKVTAKGKELVRLIRDIYGIKESERIQQIPTESEKSITFSKDEHGIQWAKRGEIQVSIPRGVKASEREAYAREKLAEQEAGQAQIRGQMPEEPTALMENAPPGGFTEADRVPEQQRFNEGQRVTWEGQRGAKLSGTIESVGDTHATINTDQIISLGGRIPIGRIEHVPLEKLSPEEQESGTLPTEEEAPSDVLATESAPAERPQLEPVGPASEGSLEEVPSEDVLGTGEAGLAAPEGGGGGAADTGGPRERDLGVRGGPSERLGAGEGEVSIPPERRGPAGTGNEPRQHTSGNRAGNDYRITDRDNIGAGGARTKYRANVAAIRTLKLIESEARLATPEEQQILVKYVGWGGIASNQLFNDETRGGKDWQEEYRELKGLLSDEEYRRARASTTNAHYTSVPVVRAIWDAARRLGFRSGHMLEPSAGIGHFLGLEPGDLADKTIWHAVELDNVSGRILKQLYQSADTRIQNYGDYRAPNDSVDLAIGNVPFGKIIVNDPAYNKHKLSIHNYFILKTLDKLRPGGVAALITSSATMDSLETKQRKLFASRADLIGAIRLPNNAFKGNAGTEVTTDILFFKKRDPDDKQGGEKFETRQEITGSDGNKIPVNEYFARHPYMMLGDMALAGKLRTGTEPTLEPKEGQNLAQDLAEAVNRLPEGVYKERPVPDGLTADASNEAIPDYKELKNYGLAVKDNKVYRRIEDHVSHQADYPKKQIQRLKEMLGVRDVARELLKAEATDKPAEELRDLRRRLNRTYDKFIEKHGIVHATANMRAMHADPDLPLMLSLENYDRETKQAEKASIFTKRVISAEKAIEHADNAKDAMLATLGQKGRLDFERMSELTGKPAGEIQSELKSEGLVFETPDGHWETHDRYLSGNVRKKLAEAEASAARDKKYQANVDALRAVIPEDVPPSKIFMKLGSGWVPPKVVRDFAAHILGVAPGQIQVGHDVLGANWSLNAPYYGIDHVRNQQTWGIPKAPASWLLEQGLNQKLPVVYFPPDDQGHRAVDQEKTTAAQSKLEALNEEFKRWTFADSPHADSMHRLYNDTLNAHVDWKPDGSHLTFPGMTPEIQLRDYQKDAIWRAVAGDTNTLLAHEVGLGKTFVMGAIAMEWKRLGLKKKPLIVFPTHLIEQNAGEILKLYPAANLLVADANSFETLNRKEFLHRIATGDWDAVLIGDSQFGRMPPGETVSKDALNEDLDNARVMLSEAKDNGDRETVKLIETQIANIEAMFERLEAKEKKDDVIPFEELGVDGLIVDEAHRMKSLPFATHMGRIRGVPQTKSQRARDTYIKTKHITKINNGNGVVFATGTPITNTMAEAWIMQKFLDEQTLKDMGMQSFDSWAGTFGETQTRPEGFPEDPTKLRMVTRFSKFNNLGQLARLFRRFADVKYASDVGLERPKMVGGQMQEFPLERTPELVEYIKSLVERAKNARGKKPEKGGDNMLVITGDGRKAAIDMRMVDPNAGDHPDSKLNRAADEVARLYHQSREQKTTQLVGLDFREGEAGFDAYNAFRNRLVKLGVPKEEVAFIQDYKKSKKLELFSKVNKGDIAVVLGSSDTLGVGVNVQKRLGAIHLVAPPYRPDMVEQTIGRGIRWGNTNKEVLVRNYMTTKSFDVNLWGILAKKADFIRKFMLGDPDLDTIEDVADTGMNYAEMEAAASGDPRLFRKFEIESKLAKLGMLRRSHDDAQFDNTARLARLPEQIQYGKDRLQKAQADLEKWNKKPEKFEMTVGGKVYSERKDAGAALNDALAAAKTEGRKVGEFAGFPIMSGSEGLHGLRDAYLAGGISWGITQGMDENREPSPMGTIHSVEWGGSKMENEIDGREREIPKLEKELEARRKQKGKPFDKQKEIEDAKAELAKLVEELGYNKAENKNQDDGGGAEPPKEAPDEDDEDDGGGLGFLGTQAIYNRLRRAWRMLKNAQYRKATQPAAGGGGGMQPPGTPPAPGVMPDEPFGGGPAMPGEKAINIRLDKLNTPDEVVDLIRRVARDQEPAIQRQRRGTISHDRLREMAEEVGLDADRLMSTRRGSAFNAEEILAARQVMLETGKAVEDARQEFQKVDSTENLLRFRAALERHQAVQKAVSGITAEAGRALNQFRLIANAVSAQRPQTMEEVLNRLGGRELNEAELRKLAQIPEDDKVGFYKFLRDHNNYSTPTKIMQYWLNNILSGAAIVHKITGDAYTSASAVPIRFLRAGIEPLTAKLQGRRREYFMRDALTENLAYLNGISNSVHKMVFVLKNGFTEEDAEDLGLPRARYELPGGYLTNWPTRNLAGATAFFFQEHYIAGIYGGAMRQALREGLSGDALKERAAALVSEPTPELVDKAWNDAKRLALIERPGELGSRFLRFRDWQVKGGPLRGFQPLRYVWPFVNIGANILKTGMRQSPMGFARLAGDEGKTSEASQIAAEAFFGTMLLAGLIYWYMQGNVTGPMPQNAGQRTDFVRSGKIPFGIKIGDTWLDTTKGWGALGLTAAATSAFGDIIKSGQALDPQAVGHAGATVGRFMLDESFLNGAQRIFKALEDPKAYGTQMVSEFASGMVPFSAMDRIVAQHIDPTVRDPQTFYERIAAGLPVLSKQVPPALDVFGEPEIRRRGVWGQQAGPMGTHANLDRELSRLYQGGLKNIPRVGSSMTIEGVKVQFTRDDRREYQIMRGNLIEQVLNGMIKSQEYRNMNDEQRIQEIEDAVHEIERYSHDQMAARIVERRLGSTAAQQYRQNQPVGGQ